MWSNFRAAQAISQERYGADQHRTVRVSDRIPDWVTSPIIRLSTIRRKRHHGLSRSPVRKVA